MNKLVLIFVLFSFTLSAQVIDTIQVPLDKFIMLNFPSKIEFKQISSSINDKIALKQEDNNLFLQFLTPNVPETNIVIKTMDGNFFSYILVFGKNPKKLNYFLSLSNAINAPATSPNSPIKENVSKKSHSDVTSQVLAESGYLKSRNITSNQGIKVVLKGIYAKDDKMYFLFNLKNSSNIVYDIKSFDFSISAQKTNSSSAELSEEITPILVKDPFYSLNKENKNIVFVFKKFTIDHDKILKFEMIEKNGDRNISFTIMPSQIDETRTIN